VVRIVGKYSGAFPPARAVDHLPIEVAKDAKGRSYTQWECFFACHFRRRPYVYIASDDYQPDQRPAASDRIDLQSAYLDSLKADGLHYAKFSDANELRIAVLRRALTIDERSFGTDHPIVASRLHNLARLLQSTKRHEEAEPLMRRAVAIRVEFTKRTGHRDPRLDPVLANYAHLLSGLGKSQPEIEAACAELMWPLTDKPPS
jgi:hypothetical protein